MESPEVDTHSCNVTCLYKLAATCHVADSLSVFVTANSTVFQPKITLCPSRRLQLPVNFKHQMPTVGK